MTDSVTPINPYEGLSHHDRKKWVCVYPAYLNSRKTIKQGRRIAKSKAIDNPTCPEIRDVCISQNLSVELEHKNYPRDPQRDQLHTGRVRVQLFNEDGEFCSETIHTRQQLYQVIAEFIPKLKTRQIGGGGGAEAAGASKKKKKKKLERYCVDDLQFVTHQLTQPHGRTCTSCKIISKISTSATTKRNATA